MLHYNPQVYRVVLCSSLGGQIVLLQHLVSSLPVNGRMDCSPLSTGVLYGRLQKATIPDAVIIQFVLLKMSIVLPDTLEDYNVTYISL